MKLAIAVLACIFCTLSLAQQSQNQHQHQNQNVGNTVTNSHNNTSNSASNAGANAGGGSSNVTDNYQRQTASAYAPPVFTSANCFKGYSAGAQTGVAGVSFGGGKIDKNCRAIVSAESLASHGSRVGYCKIMIRTQDAKDAGITMDDCMSEPIPVTAVEPVTMPEPVPTIVLADNLPVVMFAPVMPIATPKAPMRKKSHACPVK